MEIQDILNNKEKALGGKNAVITKTTYFHGMEITFHFNMMNVFDYQSIMESIVTDMDLSDLMQYSKTASNQALATAATTGTVSSGMDVNVDEVLETTKTFKLNYNDLLEMFDKILKQCIVLDKKTKTHLTDESFKTFKTRFPPSLRVEMVNLIIEESGLSEGKPDINS